MLCVSKRAGDHQSNQGPCKVRPSYVRLSTVMGGVIISTAEPNSKSSTADSKMRCAPEATEWELVVSGSPSEECVTGCRIFLNFQSQIFCIFFLKMIPEKTYFCKKIQTQEREIQRCQRLLLGKDQAEGSSKKQGTKIPMWSFSVLVLGSHLVVLGTRP